MSERADALVPVAEWRVDPSSPVPLYFQLSENIRAWIDTTAAAGARVLPEEQLAEQLNVSRATVRKAIERLENDGLLYRRRGMGTFVAAPRLNRKMRLTSSANDIFAAGRAVHTRLLRRYEQPAGDDIVADRLQVPPDEPVIFLERVRYADSRPAALLRNWLPRRLAEPVISADLDTRTLYEVLERDCGITLGHAVQTLQARMPDEGEATLLEIPVTEPVMRVMRQSFSTTGEAVEWSDCLYPAELSEFVATIEP
jgi:GntR family transcriptional regulator